MNSTVGPSFKEKFTKIYIYGSRKQYTKPTQKMQSPAQTHTRAIQTNTYTSNSI